MSRSLRKTPIFGHTRATSEKDDKRRWHKRWRSQERTARNSVANLEDHVTQQIRDASNIWDMAKDGRHWFGKRQQQTVAQQAAERRGKNSREVALLKRRLLRRWSAK